MIYVLLRHDKGLVANRPVTVWLVAFALVNMGLKCLGPVTNRPVNMGSVTVSLFTLGPVVFGLTIYEAVIIGLVLIIGEVTI